MGEATVGRRERNGQRTALPDLFNRLNAVIDESSLQSDRTPRFVRSPSLGIAEISLDVDAMTMKELLKIKAEVAHIRFIHSGRWIVVAPVVAE